MSPRPRRHRFRGSSAIFLRATMWLAAVGLLGAVVFSWSAEGLVFQLTRTDLSAGQKVDALKQFFEACGLAAPAVYVVFVTVEVVVAPIPGLMLYAPGGLIFGAFGGGFLALLGNVLGAGIACYLTRNLHLPWFDAAETKSPTYTKMQEALQHRGGWLVFLLRLNPLTSSDLVSYAAGFTRIPVWQVMLATAGGMAPLCFVQAWLSESLFAAFPKLIYPLLAASVLYLALVVWVIRRLISKESPEPS